VFCISAGIYLVGAIIFAIIGTGETQEWAIRSSKDIEIETRATFVEPHYHATSLNMSTDNKAYGQEKKDQESDEKIVTDTKESQ
jgi:hypothetical protein